MIQSPSRRPPSTRPPYPTHLPRRHRPAPGRNARLLAAGPVLAAVLAAVAACGGGTPVADPSPSTSPPIAGYFCASDRAGGTQVRFTDQAGASLAGVELGSGSVGVVLAHVAGENVCDWLPYGQELAKAGYRVLAFDFAGSGVSDPLLADDDRAANVVAAAAFLRGEGASSVVLMGGSMGANASLVAATRIDPPVAGVISLSSPLTYQGLSALEAVGKLTVPVLYIAGDADGNFADMAKTLDEATPSGVPHKLVIAYSAAHGPNLLFKGIARKDAAREAVSEFLATYAPVG